MSCGLFPLQMNHSKEAEDYLNGEHIRYLNPDNSIPSLNDRVKEAFDAGARSVKRSFSNLDCVGIDDKGKINFPNWNE